MISPSSEINPTLFLYGICMIAAYAIGSVPFGFIVGKSHGIDIRTKGSGNIGATNVFRTIGKGWGVLTFMLDVVKGFVSAYTLPLLAAKFMHYDSGQSLNLLCACSAVAGHNWPVFLKFKGGKGIATTAGALLGIAPSALGIGLLTWLIVFPLSRYVSLASIAGATAMTISGWFLFKDDGILIPMFLTLMGCLAVIRHKSNIKRLMNGSENRFNFKKRKDANESNSDR